MKKLFISMLAVAALASCSKEQTIVADQGELIGFSTFVENSTRATDTTYGAATGQTPLEAFNLYGTVTGTNGTINIYNGCPVAGEVGAATWNCPVSQYWIKDAVYDFAAVVDATVAQDQNSPYMPITLTTIANADMNFSDMLYAQKLDYTALASENPTVVFAFEHLLSKAMFTVTSNTQDGYYYSVKNINVNNFESGTYTIAYKDEDTDGKDDGSWVGNAAKSIPFGDVDKVTASGAKTCDTQKLLVPTAAPFTVSCTIELWNDNGDAEDVKLGTENKTFNVTTPLVKGNSYNFTLALSVGQKIEFTVTSDPSWNPAEGGSNVTLQ
jgi:hypothetical protein